MDDEFAINILDLSYSKNSPVASNDRGVFASATWGRRWLKAL
jgi:hypothetical protein